ncbi:alpha/beta hydrolase [Streptomyces sp. NPDC046261]|uniref:alpha/beta hydrolase family protein n=1 Tax=Streptomyces sp. NPDC046261 TaxID=3157200 RepID=UPI0033E5B95A
MFRTQAPGRDGATPAMDRRTVTKSAALAGALLLASAGGGGGIARAQDRRAAAGDVVVRLPAPTGPHRTGVTTLYLVDRSRRDPWDRAIPVREVMVTVFYPARAVGGHRLAPWMTADAAASYQETAPAIHPELPRTGVRWAATMTHSYADAPARPVRRPVLLYSPGGGDPRTLGTGIAEELAGRGYVVVTIDHPGDASEVDFPDKANHRNKVRDTVLRGDPRTDPDLFRTVIATRIADTRFVLDQLAVLASGGNPDACGRALPEGLGRALDMRRVGVYGHSAGGTTAAQALYEDRRIRAAVTMEGFLDHPPQTPGTEGELFPVARYGVDRPLLLLGTDGFSEKRQLERSWSAMLAHGKGHTGRRQLADARHWVFTDHAATVPQLQAAGLMTAAGRDKLVGTVAPATSVPWVRHCLLSFFTRHLPSH